MRSEAADCRAVPDPGPDAPRLQPSDIRLAFSRRRFLEASGAALVVATILAACDRAGERRQVTLGAATGRASPTSTTTSTTRPPVDPATEVDILVLSTASSIEHYAAGVYTDAAGLDVVKSAALISAMELFADHHSQHASAFEAATEQVGGIPYAQPNPALRLAALQQLGAIRTESDVLRLVYFVEHVAAATYVASAGQFSQPSLNGTIMSVGAVEAMHMTVLASLASGASLATGSSAASGVSPASGASPGSRGSAPPGPASLVVPWPSSGFASVAGAIAPGSGM